MRPVAVEHTRCYWNPASCRSRAHSMLLKPGCVHALNSGQSRELCQVSTELTCTERAFNTPTLTNCARAARRTGWRQLMRHVFRHFRRLPTMVGLQETVWVGDKLRHDNSSDEHLLAINGDRIHCRDGLHWYDVIRTALIDRRSRMRREHQSPWLTIAFLAGRDTVTSTRRSCRKMYAEYFNVLATHSCVTITLI